MSTDKQMFTYDEAKKFLDTLNAAPVDWKAYARRSADERMAYGVNILQLTTVHGYSLRRIESELGIPRATAARYRAKALEAIATPVIENARAMELERLEELAEALWPAAISGDDKAANTYLKIMDKRIALLGLAKPIEVHQTVVEVTAAEMELQQLLAQAERDMAMEASKFLEGVDTL